MKFQKDNLQSEELSGIFAKHKRLVSDNLIQSFRHLTDLNLIFQLKFAFQLVLWNLPYFGLCIF